MSSRDFDPATPKVELEVFSNNEGSGTSTGAQASKGFKAANFLEYSFNSNYLTPTDGWSFVMDRQSILDAADGLRTDLLGKAVQIKMDGAVVCTGYVDSVEVSGSRAGTEYRIEGRDALAPAIDGGASPYVKFKEGMSFLDVLHTLFSPFGWTNKDADYVEVNTGLQDLRLRTDVRGKTRTSQQKGFGKRSIKDFKAHMFRPYPREGVYQFASRMAQRFGVWIRTSPDGKQLIIGRPDFDQVRTYELWRTYERGNVLDGTVKFSVENQPTLIVADGWAYAGEFGHGKLKSIIENKALRVDDPEFEATKKKFPSAHNVQGGYVAVAADELYVPRNKVVYMHDDESTQQEHLDNYVKRELALMQRKIVEAKYTVEGHGQWRGGTFIPWTIDSIVKVEDRTAGLLEHMYVLGLTFTRSRAGGTKTHLELIRKNTLDL